jgi:hypothetical protein
MIFIMRPKRNQVVFFVFLYAIGQENYSQQQVLTPSSFFALIINLSLQILILSM